MGNLSIGTRVVTYFDGAPRYGHITVVGEDSGYLVQFEDGMEYRMEGSEIWQVAEVSDNG